LVKPQPVGRIKFSLALKSNGNKLADLAILGDGLE